MTQAHVNEDLMEKGELRSWGIDPKDPVPASPVSTQESGQSTNTDKTVIAQVETPKQPSSLFRQLQLVFKNWRTIIFSRHQQSMEPRRTTVRKLQECPEGYPRLAAFLDSDENFMLYRRFGFLQSRILLNKQDELRELERGLEKLDEADRKNNPLLLRSREKDVALNGRRKKLLNDSEEKFKEYAQLLSVARDIASFNRPTARDYLSIKSYFDEEAPLCNAESYIYRKEDIISLKPGRENAWLDAFVERVLQKLSCKAIRYLFCSPDLCQKTDPKETGIILYSRQSINFVVSLIITTMILILLIIPVYILWHMTRIVLTGRTTSIIIGVLLVATLVFSAALSLFTRAKRHEILASAAAYCAVLVVFIGNVGQFSPAQGS